jgi:polyhydroxyalkanoate synthesis repressor PhaR
MIVKRYSNRRLYDTDESRYITMSELADKIRAGSDVRVVDAKTGEDLTQVTLTQIIIESRGAGRMFQTPVLIQLIRLGDDSLAEFLGRYMSTALEMYLQIKRGAQNVAPYFPFAQMPMDASSAFARMMMGATPWMEQTRQQPPAAASPSSEVAEMRKELDELKQAMRGGKKKR